MEPACSPSSGVAGQYCSLFRNSAQRMTGGKTVTGDGVQQKAATGSSSDGFFCGHNTQPAISVAVCSKSRCSGLKAKGK